MTRPSLGLSRREFVRRLCLTSTGTLAAAACLPDRAWSDDDTPDGEETRYRSHGPTGRWLDGSEELIDRLIRPEPEGRQINEDLYVSSRLENVFFINLNDRAVLVDTGFDHQVDRHLDVLESLGCDLSKIVAILATHSHVDHTGGLARARDRLSAPVIAHPNAVEPISTGDLLRTAAVIPELKGWEFKFPECPVDETVDHEDVIQIGDERIEVLHIPGHTPDCVGYVWNDQFFTGDAVFGAGLIGWANERWLSNYTDHAETMLDLIRTKPDVQKFYCAHGPDLPYDTPIPEACLRTLERLMADDGDPCNHTPRTVRRADDEPPRTLELPAA